MFYLGLDLGKLRDFTALAAVEQTVAPHSSRQWLAVRYLERASLGTPYMRVVQPVSEVTKRPVLNGLCHLTVDATGVGVPVMESLRAADLGCRGMTAVTITGGNQVRQATGFGFGEHWNVPRTDLLTGLQVLLERGELKIAKGMPEAGTLMRELISMRTENSSEAAEHDDLVLAVALACWQAKRPWNSMGTQRLF